MKPLLTLALALAVTTAGCEGDEEETATETMEEIVDTSEEELEETSEELEEAAEESNLEEATAPIDVAAEADDPGLTSDD